MEVNLTSARDVLALILIIYSFTSCVNVSSTLDTGFYNNITNYNAFVCKNSTECGFGMNCVGARCICADKNEYYDRRKKFCARKVGSECNRTQSGSGSEEKTDPCVSYSDCDSITGRCVCNGQHLSAADDGRCLLNYGVGCVQDHIDFCNPEKHLLCNIYIGLCDCQNLVDQRYDTRTGRCNQPPGKGCEPETKANELDRMKSKCGAHATCLEDNLSSDYYYYGVCKCDPGYIHVNKNHADCSPSFGGSCNSTQPCAEGLNLVCQNESNSTKTDSATTTCQCEPNAVLDGRTNDRCGLKLGTSCTLPQDIDSTCIENARCNDKSLTCECKFGYSRTAHETCKLDHDTFSCSSKNENCNESAGLRCIGETCHCEAGQFFNKTLGKCVVRDVIKGCKPKKQHPICEKHIICNPDDQNCTCHDPLAYTISEKDWFCYPGLGAPCNSNISDVRDTSCPNENYLVCSSSSGACECKNTSTSLHQNDESRCFLKAGEKCAHKSQQRVRYETCVRHAVCNSETEICECVNGYEPTKSGICGRSHNGVCVRADNECNPDAFLSCLQNGRDFRCVCDREIGLVYDDFKESCVSLSGFKCRTDHSGPFCAQNSECNTDDSNFVDAFEGVCECLEDFVLSNSSHYCKPTKAEKNEENSSNIGGTSEGVNQSAVSTQHPQIFLSILLSSLLFYIY